MNIAIFLLTVCTILLVVASTPIDPARWLVNRPKIDQFGVRQQRSPPSAVKGAHIGNRKNLEHQLKKGEYVCGDRICKLPAGVPPPGCEDGLCQYPLKLQDVSGSVYLS